MDERKKCDSNSKFLTQQIHKNHGTQQAVAHNSSDWISLPLHAKGNKDSNSTI